MPTIEVRPFLKMSYLRAGGRAGVGIEHVSDCGSDARGELGCAHEHRSADVGRQAARQRRQALALRHAIDAVQPVGSVFSRRSRGSGLGTYALR